MRTKRGLLVCVLFASSLSFAAGQAAAGYQPNVTVMQDDTQLTIQANGASDEERWLVLRVNNESAIAAMSQRRFEYNAELETLQILEAYTLTPDGKRLNVAADRIYDQPGPYSSEPVYGSDKERVVVFQGLQRGGSVAVHWRRSASRAFWPDGKVDYVWRQSRHDQVLSARLTVLMPKSMGVRWQASGMAAVAASGSGDSVRWTWQYSQPQALMPEPSSVSEDDYSPWVAFSNFSDYADLAHAYWSRAQDKAAVTPGVQQLADQLTAGLADRRAQERALYDWVSRHIRWVGVYFGYGGVVPHSADEVIANRYGDCKDHATLLQALLAAKGIRSSQALIQAGASWWVSDTVPVHFSDHVINYLPDEDRFVDSTIGLAPFGQLADSEQGKPVLVMDDGTGRPRLMRTPVDGSTLNRAVGLTHLRLLADGSMQGATNLQLAGVPELSARRFFNQLPPGSETHAAESWLAETQQTGSGRLLPGSPTDLHHAFAYRTQFTLSEVADLSQPGGMAVPLGLRGRATIASRFADTNAAIRQTPLWIEPGLYQEETVIDLPAKLQVLALPRPLRLSTPFGDYQSSYQRQGGQLRVTRRLRLDWPQPYLAPADYAAYKAMGERVLQDLRSQFLFQSEPM
ncbi:DUF3857 and transglutaminase domain-containing protein [Paludibacterium sp. THUN1379]|uniref:DUF3857 and transglutaminase domain-containing protein n=1 Tax=Paludibacterium sp. THUN1379 TaxID=3112107 RepID=UPI0030D5930D